MIKTILVPLDGAPLAEAALAFLAGEQFGRTADRILLRMVEPVVGTPVPLVPGGGRPDLAAACATDRRRAMAAEYLAAVGRHHPWETPWRTQVALGYPSDEILRVATAEQADLIVLATHGRQGLDRLIHGSVAGTLLHHAPIPLLLIRPPMKV